MKDIIKIGKKEVGQRKPVYIIAEVGMNHNGQFDLAEKHIRVAAECGVDAVKFQTFKTELFYSRKFASFEERKKAELPFEWHESLKRAADEVGVEFLSTPFDENSADFLEKLGVSCFKVASSDLNNYPFLQYLAQKGKPMIISTGFSDLATIKKAVDSVTDKGNDQIILLHCIAVYPSDNKDLNLKAIITLRDTFGCAVGLSDHSLGSCIAPIAAVALGASVIEKHFTLDKTFPGYDHKMSASPEELREFVRNIRLTEAALGSGIKQPVEAETKRSKKAQRSLYWKDSYKEGTIIKADMILCLRPADGLLPEMKNQLCGLRLRKPVKADDLIIIDDIEGQ
jgi:N-acetylneuraminate synthase/N,N'-diacetyllegionaminate synthase